MERQFLETNKDFHKRYIASSEWKSKKLLFIDSEETENDCYTCGKTYILGFHLHHTTYARLGNENFDDLKMLCPECHTNVSVLHRFHSYGVNQATEEVKRLYGKLPGHVITVITHRKNKKKKKQKSRPPSIVKTVTVKHTVILCIGCKNGRPKKESQYCKRCLHNQRTVKQSNGKAKLKTKQRERLDKMKERELVQARTKYLQMFPED